MKQPLVSVILPSYNSEEYISEAIASILSQTYRNIELIIVDGHSTDRTIEIIDTFRKQDNRVKIIYDNGGGLGASLHVGCLNAKGKYVARMDSDDLSLPHRLENEVGFLESNPDYVLVSSSVYYINENGDVIGRSFACTDSDIIRDALLRTNLIVHPMAMFRKDAYNKSGGYLPVKMSEDRIFWSRLAKLGKMMNIASPLGKYRLLPNSLDHIINPYSKIILEFRNKMVSDDVILESDIQLYNTLSDYSKKFVIRNTNKGYERKKSIEEKLFSILRLPFGEKIAEKIIVEIKNQYYRIRLS